MGFSVPLARWISGPLRGRVEEAVNSERLRALGVFDERVLRGLVDAHCAGKRDYGATLWALLMFEGFLRTLEADPSPAQAPVGA